MNRFQLDVEDCHRVFGINIASEPGINRPELRSALISEECKELLESITGEEVFIEFKDNNGTKSLVNAIDGMCDLIYVVLGTAIEFGIDLTPFWDEVHRSNMEKLGGESLL